ncbi:hypothetical protein CC2G_013130, partial [Coprinopsis cinerea AmutBmut pab1-1]
QALLDLKTKSARGFIVVHLFVRYVFYDPLAVCFVCWTHVSTSSVPPARVTRKTALPMWPLCVRPPSFVSGR